jgi:hypothetical protein
VETLFDAIEKPVVSKDETWFEINPKIFKQNSLQLKNKVLYLEQNKSPNNVVKLDRNSLIFNNLYYVIMIHV